MSGTPNEATTATTKTVDDVRNHPEPAYAPEHKWKKVMLLDGREWRVPRLSIIASKREVAARAAMQKMLDLYMELQKVRADVLALQGNVTNAQKLFDKLVEDDTARALEFYNKVERYTNEARDIETKHYARFLKYREISANVAYELLRLIYPKMTEVLAADLVDQDIADSMLRIAQGMDQDENPTNEGSRTTGSSPS